MLPCLNPLSLNVFPKGSKVNKDGSDGCFLSFGSSGELPKLGYWYRPFASYGDDTPFNLETKEGAVGYIVSCGRCINCRRNKSFRWTRRLLMESDAYQDDDMCFLTLTYDDDHLPVDGLLNYEHVQGFLKRLRKSVSDRLRFFCCGEYGDTFGRPHYHMILFGHDFFTGSKIAGYGENGVPLFHHSVIDSAWPFGFAEFGTCDQASIQYVAGYVAKKYKTDNIHPEAPPFVRMSLKPGIGRLFLEKHVDQIERDGGFYLRGKFYTVDSASLRYLIKECSLLFRLLPEIQLQNKEIAELLSNQYKLVSNLDKDTLDKTLAKCYNIRNRLGDIYGKVKG